MKFRMCIDLAIMGGVLAVAHAQTHNPFQTAYDANQVFELRDSVEPTTAQPFYKGAVEASANRVSAAEKDLYSVIKHDPHSKEAYEAHDLLGNLYFRNAMYHKGYKEIVAALEVRPDASDPKSMLSILKALNSLPTMTIVESKSSNIAIEPGSTFLPLKANGKDMTFFFDTGAAISVIGESAAKAIGIMTKPVDGKMGDASGRSVSGIKLALVSDLRIGGLHLRNVPFVVVEDSGEPWNQLPRSKHGIIGLPLLLAMHTIRWSLSGKFETGLTSEAFDLGTCNMLFHNSNPVIDVIVESRHLNFTLDTGAVDTDLNPAFATALPALMKNGKPERRSIEGLGGSISSDSILLPSAILRIGNRNTVLEPAHVFTQHGNGAWAAGNLGMDVLKQAPMFVLDFNSMTLRLD